MENSENPTPQEKKALDDSLKLFIREEIENEVEKRIQKQEGFYWKFLALFGGFVAVFAYALWHVQLNELPGVVQKELATQAVIQAKDKIMEIKSSVETENQNVNATASTVSNILNSLTDNQQAFTNRLNEIKQQDNVVLADDLQKLFVVQAVTNLIDGNKIILDFDPIADTITITYSTVQYNVRLDYFANIEGKTIVFKPQYAPSFSQETTNGLKVEYIRKSLR
jgi:hypothetical protein